MMEWLKEGERMRYLALSVPAAIIGSILFVLGFAFGREKESSRKPWDWRNIGAYAIGGGIGQIIQILILLLVL